MKKLVAEFFGTSWLILGGCGSAVISASIPELGIGYLGVSLAFGLTVVTMAYALGHISGCHLNPAITLGLWVGGRIQIKMVIPYIIAQVLGAIFGAAILYFIVTGSPEYNIGNFAANGFDEHSPGGYSVYSALLTEIILTFFFVIIVLGVTHSKADKHFGGLAIGLGLTLIHLISIPITNTSVNPARSTSQALFVGDWALDQLWLFWLAPIIGAILAGMLYNYLAPEHYQLTNSTKE